MQIIRAILPFKAVTSYNTPGFRDLVKRGAKLPPHPYALVQRTSYTKYSILSGGSETNLGVVHGTDGVRNGYFSQTESYTETFNLSSLLTDVENQLSKDLRSRPIDLGIAMRERGETAEFIAGSLTRCANTLSAIKRRDYSTAINQLFRGKSSCTFKYRDKRGRVRKSTKRVPKPSSLPKEPAEAYMALSWGFQPLLEDIKGAIEVFESTPREEIEINVNRPVSDRYVFLRTPRGDVSGRSVNLSYTGSVRGKFTAEVDNSFLYSLSSLGVTNPVATIYKTMPLTFLTDWFLPIGSWLDGLVDVPGLINQETTIAYSFWGTASSFYIEPPGASYFNQYSGMRTGYENLTDVIKERFIKSSQPVFTLKAPDNPLSGGKIFGVIALITSFVF